MKFKEKLKYISNRALVLGTVIFGVFIILAVIQLLLAYKGETPWWMAIIITIFAILFPIVFWLWIHRPYMRCEKMTNRFLDGYIFSEKEDMELLNLTPSIQKQMKMVDRIVRSPQYMDLNKRQAQYLALQNQINPHFLYNTLESIRGEAIIAGLDSVADMTEALARFFRYTITKVENLVSVEEELDNCETYFGIQKYRFGDRLQLHIDYDIAEYEKIMNCRIPKLTLQPILENSIIHGVELKVGGGNLYIRFQCTKDRLLIRISDDGVGMDEMTLAKLNQKLGKSTKAIHDNEEKQGGIALVNVNNRIHLIFGDEYGMHVYSVPGEGTDVEIGAGTMLEDFENQLIGVTTGEDTQISFTFPEDYNQEVAGKDVQFDIHVNSVKAYDMPEWTDEDVQENTDYDSLEDMESSIREELQQSAEKDAEDNWQYDLIKQVMESSEFQIEDADVEAYIDQMVSEYDSYAAANGMETEQFLQQYLGVTMEQLREMFRETATFRVKMTLAFHEIAEQEGLTVSDEEYQERLSALASQYGYDDPSKIEQVYSAEMIKEEMIQEKAINFIEENAQEISE